MTALLGVVNAVLALMDGWESDAGPSSDAERVFGKQVVSVEFAVAQIRTAINAALEGK
jgi:hypothetical protein